MSIPSEWNAEHLFAAFELLVEPSGEEGLASQLERITKLSTYINSHIEEELTGEISSERLYRVLQTTNQLGNSQKGDESFPHKVSDLCSNLRMVLDRKEDFDIRRDCSFNCVNGVFNTKRDR
jgi:hypothetical protein